jgi:hypothetical protein
MAVKKTGSTAKKFTKPSYIVATLFSGSEENDVPLGDSFIIEDVVADSTSLSPDDNETTDIECETSDSPILSIVKLGKYQFAAEVADTQKDLLVSLLGFKAGTTDTKKYFAPAQYKKSYAKIDVVFDDGETKTAFVLPKVQLNSKLMLESLNTNVGRISLAGTAYDADISDGEGTVRTPFYVDTNYTLPVAG